MKQNKKLWALAVLLLAAAWWWFGKSAEKTDPNSTINVTVSTVTRQDVPITVQLVGNVVAYESVAVKSRLDSQVMEVRFKDGDFVEEGQVLFVLDDRAITAQISQLQATLEKEKANLANAQLMYTRSQQLRKTQVVAQAQVDQTKAAFDAQAAQVNASQAALENTQVLLSFTKITAPIAGRTGTIGVTRGNNVKANDTQALVTINRISPIRLQFAIAQHYYDKVREVLAAGDVKVVAQNKESSTPVEGKLEYLENTIDVASGTFAARAVFQNTDEKLWPGMFVNIVLDLGTMPNARTIPAVAVQGDEGK
ncbi:MAG: efflux RND transporter periplasmic adaptor subunit, partial [Rickettsiales bacterium]|nr:efflux RND transporter periplasmic adaptor subunit [Rickettsiales bacterium]